MACALGLVAAALGVWVLNGAGAGTPDRRSADPSRPQPSGEPAGEPTGGPPPPPHEGWQPSLAENFDRLDGAVWNVRDQEANANEDSYLLARNVGVSDGLLRIQARRESAGGRGFTSGYLDTNHKYALPNYFRAEVRAKVPLEQGLWAAPLWLRPADYSGGEIDVVETYGSESARPVVHHTIHTEYGPGHATSARLAYLGPLGDPSGRGWHVYTVEKTPGLIRMWVDGRLTATWSSADPAWFDRYYEAGKSWHLRVNLQVGGEWGGLPDHTTDWRPERTALLVDYIRTWVPD